jgi:hypothetical protein
MPGKGNGIYYEPDNEPTYQPDNEPAYQPSGPQPSGPQPAGPQPSGPTLRVDAFGNIWIGCSNGLYYGSWLATGGSKPVIATPENLLMVRRWLDDTGFDMPPRP